MEATETVEVTLTSTDNGQVTVAGSPLSANITSNDTATVSLTAKTDGAEAGPVAATFTVTMTETNDTGSPITVNYSFSGGTATGGAGNDYTNTTTSTTIANGSSTGTITVPVLNDALLEATETVEVTLTSTDNGQVTVAGSPLSANITSNDTATVSLTAKTDGAEAGPVAATFTVTMTKTNDTGSPITVNYSFSGGTATGGAGNDYTNTTTSTTIANGDTTGTITVPVLNDALLEATETVEVTLTSTDNGQVTVAGSPLSANITSNDTATVSLTAKTDGAEAGPVAATFTVTMTKTNDTGSPITVNYSFSGGTATGGAGNDYTNTTTAPR